jgi:hypothetical protein
VRIRTRQLSSSIRAEALREVLARRESDLLL